MTPSIEDAARAYASGSSTFIELLATVQEVDRTHQQDSDSGWLGRELGRFAIKFDLTFAELSRLRAVSDPGLLDHEERWGLPRELGYSKYTDRPASPGAVRGLGLGLRTPDLCRGLEDEIRSQFDVHAEMWECPQCGLTFGARDGHRLFYPWGTKGACGDCRQILNLHHLSLLLDVVCSELRPDGEEGARFHAARELYQSWMQHEALPIDVLSLRASPVGLDLLGHYRRAFTVLDVWGMRVSADSPSDLRSDLNRCADALSTWKAGIPDGFLAYWR